MTVNSETMLPVNVTLQDTVARAGATSEPKSIAASEPTVNGAPLNSPGLVTNVSVGNHTSPPSTSACGEVGYLYAPLIPTLVSAVLVVVGWGVLTKTQANRERRKQIREHVAALKRDLDALEEMAVDYHTSTREMAVEQRVVSRLGRFEKACSSLPRLLGSQTIFKAMDAKGLVVSPEHLKRLSQAMTLNHFADEHTNALTIQDELVQRIEMASEVVHEDLELVRIAALD